MKQKIRLQTFETNSSSVHSIVIAKGGDKNLTNDYSDKIEGGDYDWGLDIYDNPSSLLSYLWTYANGIEHLEEKLKRCFPNVTFVPFDTEDYFCPHIDHQSIDLPSQILQMSDEELIDIVNRGILIIDNDNGGYETMPVRKYEDGNYTIYRG